MAMTIEDKLGHNRFNVDSSYAHIHVKDTCDEREDGSIDFNYEGCLECGTCRVLTHGRIVESWDHPMGGMGVAFRKG